MKCLFSASMYQNIVERKLDKIFFNACIYICGKYKELVALVGIKAL